jgi:predicted O-methyltransferase YrrM
MNQYMIPVYLIELIKYYLRVGRRVPAEWVARSDSALLRTLIPGASVRSRRTKFSAKIEVVAERTRRLGRFMIWEGYGDRNRGSSDRNSDDVRTHAREGNLYSWLVASVRPKIIVEFGTAFGISGMYWLAGLETSQVGRLYTFEPNGEWLAIARTNLSEISANFTAVQGTFEEKMTDILEASTIIDIAFIDAIHTSDFVLPQLELVLSRTRKGSIVVLDDINFSPDMAACWRRVANDQRFSASVSLGRIGLLEVA